MTNKDLYRYLKKFHKDYGFVPCAGHIAGVHKCSKANIYEMLTRLQTNGYIELPKGRLKNIIFLK